MKGGYRMDRTTNPERLLKQLAEKLPNGLDTELSLDDLEHVNGGYTVTYNDDNTATIELTEEELRVWAIWFPLEVLHKLTVPMEKLDEYTKKLDFVTQIVENRRKYFQS